MSSAPGPGVNAMPRSSTGWRARLRDSRSSAPVGPRTLETKAPAALTAIPDRRRRLSDGVLVDASIQARLLGLRLLTVDASIVLVPADVTGTSPAAPPPAPRSSAPVPRRTVAAGPRLAQAVRSLNEAAEVLAETRRDGA